PNPGARECAVHENEPCHVISTKGGRASVLRVGMRAQELPVRPEWTVVSRSLLWESVQTWLCKSGSSASWTTIWGSSMRTRDESNQPQSLWPGESVNHLPGMMCKPCAGIGP